VSVGRQVRPARSSGGQESPGRRGHGPPV